MRIEYIFYSGTILLGLITIIYFLSEYIVFLPRIFKVVISFAVSIVFILLGNILRKMEV